MPYADPAKKAANNAAYYRSHKMERKAYFRARYLAERKDIQKYQNLLRKIKHEDHLRNQGRATGGKDQ